MKIDHSSVCHFDALKHFQAIIDSSDDAIVAKTTEGIVTSWNPAAERMFGFCAADIVGRHITTIFPPDRLEEESQILDRIRQGEKVDHFETVRLHRDGSRVNVSATISPIIGEDGRIVGVSKIARDITGRLEAEQAIWRLAYHDTLTGLPNRRMFMDRLRREMARASRERSRFALMSIDLDDFKKVNDSLGHQAGDRLLEEVAARITNGLRASDTVARLGGDEFTALLPDVASATDVRRLADRLNASLREPVDCGTDRACVSASIGITFFPDDALALDDLLRRADEALYFAKRAGRNMSWFFSDLNRR